MPTSTIATQSRVSIYRLPPPFPILMPFTTVSNTETALPTLISYYKSPSSLQALSTAWHYLFFRNRSGSWSRCLSKSLAHGTAHCGSSTTVGINFNITTRLRLANGCLPSRLNSHETRIAELERRETTPSSLTTQHGAEGDALSRDSNTR